MKPTLLIALFGLLCAGQAAAQTKPDGVAASMKNFLECRSLTDNMARLACYDAVGATIGEAVTKGDIVVIDRAQAQTARRQAFGFSLSGLAIFDKAEKPEDADRLVSKVASANRGANGKWVFELEDGAVWAQIDDQDISRDPKKGSEVEIRKAAVGSFFLNSDGQRAMRARRVK